MHKVGVGTRTLSFFVDTILIFILSFIAIKILNWYAFYYRTYHFNFGEVFAIVLVIYYTAFESISGRSPGKKISLTKVVTANGAKPGFFRILLRSITRVILIDPFFLPFTQRTLHDIVSGTDVVEI
jgi:uncharacterized RDD family membrane protein YckC